MSVASHARVLALRARTWLIRRLGGTVPEPSSGRDLEISSLGARRRAGDKAAADNFDRRLAELDRRQAIQDEREKAMAAGLEPMRRPGEVVELPMRCCRCRRVLDFDPRYVPEFNLAESDQLKCEDCGGTFRIDERYTRKPALWRRVVRAITDALVGE